MAQTRMNGMFMQGPAGINRERLQSEFASTVTESAYQAAAFAGLNAGNTHLQASPDTNTSSVIIAALADHKLVIWEIAAMTTGGAGDFTGTFAASGSDDDLFVYTGTQYSEARWQTKIVLPENTALIHYRCAGNTGSATSDLNTVTVAYTYIPA